MNIVIFGFKATRIDCSPNMAEIIAISAIKMKAGCRDKMQRFGSLCQCKPPLPGWCLPSALRQAPSLVEALIKFSRFVGDAWLIADAAPIFKMPYIHQGCAGPGQATREVRVVDSADFARKLWDDASFDRLDDLAGRLDLPPAVEEEGIRQLITNVDRLAEAVHQMWSRLSSDFEVCPVGSCLGLLPALDEEPCNHGIKFRAVDTSF